MKKLFAMFAVLFVFVGVLFAQGGGILGDIDINTIFASIAGVAAGSVLISALLIKWFKTEKSWAKQLISWVAPVVIFITGNLLNFGFMAEFTWLMTVVYGLGAALVSNGIFDIELVRALLAALNLEKAETE